MNFENNKNSKTLMEKSEQYRDTKMTRRFHPACPVPPPGEVTLVWCPLCSEIQRFGDLAPLCLLAVVETGEVAASGGGSLLPGLAPSGQGHVHTHTPWAAWSVTAPTHPHGCGLSPHGRSPEHLRRWWRGRWLWLSCCCCSEPPSPADTPLSVLLPGGGEALPPSVRAVCPVRPDVRRRRGDVPAR